MLVVGALDARARAAGAGRTTISFQPIRSGVVVVVVGDARPPVERRPGEQHLEPRRVQAALARREGELVRGRRRAAPAGRRRVRCAFAAIRRAYAPRVDAACLRAWKVGISARSST